MDGTSIMQWVLVFILTFIEILTEAKECLKNDDIGWRDGNVYSCNDPDKPKCCEQDQQFTCCEAPSSIKLREQMQLFGMITFVVIVMFVIYMFLKKDVVVFSSPTLKESILSCIKPNCSREKPQNNTIQEEEVNEVREQPEEPLQELYKFRGCRLKTMQDSDDSFSEDDEQYEDIENNDGYANTNL